MILKDIRLFVTKTNEIFIAVVLALFYFAVIGPIAMLYSVRKIFKQEKPQSYWLEPRSTEYSDDYFINPY